MIKINDKNSINHYKLVLFENRALYFSYFHFIMVNIHTKNAIDFEK